MKLSKLAKGTGFTSEQQRVFLGLLKEVEAFRFVEELCQVAYDLGFDDCIADSDDKYDEFIRMA